MDEIKTFSQFVDAFPRNRAKYQNFALRFVRDRSAVEDLVNDSLAKTLEKRQEEGHANIEAYFYTIVKSQCLNWLRHKAIQYKVHQEIQDTTYRLLQYDIASVETFDTSQLFCSEIRDILTRQLEKMPELRVRIFIDNRLKEMTYEQIAEKYGLTRYRVWQEIHSVLDHLRICLRDFLPTILVISVSALSLF